MMVDVAARLQNVKQRVGCIGRDVGRLDAYNWRVSPY